MTTFEKLKDPLFHLCEILLTICPIPLFVMIYLACIKPYNISAACSIKSLWFGFSSSSSSENENP
jgi:hypothetical protein